MPIIENEIAYECPRCDSVNHNILISEEGKNFHKCDMCGKEFFIEFDCGYIKQEPPDDK